jgi:two-component system, cell cycle sensor histidine kinase and response regulator CckA
MKSRRGSACDSDANQAIVAIVLRMKCQKKYTLAMSSPQAVPNTPRSSVGELLHSIQTTVDAIIVECDDRIVTVNPSFLRLCRYPQAEGLIGQPVSVLHAAGDSERILEIKRRSSSGDRLPGIFEYQGRCGDGTQIDLEAFVSASQIGGQTLLVSIVRDISGRKKADQDLRDSEAHLHAVVEGLGQGLLIADPEGVVQSINSWMLAMTGFTAQEIVGKRAFEVLQPGREWEIIVRRNQLRLTGIPGRYQTQLLRKDGSSFWAEVNAEPFHNAEGTFVGTLAAVSDITERKQAEQRLRFQADVLSQVREAIVAVGNDTLVSYWNQGAELLYGFKFYQALGKPLEDLIGYDCSKAFETEDAGANQSGAGVWFEETTHRKKSGEQVFVELSISRLQDADGQPIGYLALIRDISERLRSADVLRQKEEQLRQSQKMEAIGKLAGGVAHDFNNLLTAISGYSEMILKRLDRQHPLRGDVEEIKRAGNRAAELTRQLLAFSRKQVLQPQLLDLNAVVFGMDKMLRRLIGADIELVTVLDPSLATIRADRGQIEQVILNLAVNARDAMPTGGKLILETVNVDDDFRARATAAETGRYVMLAVGDTGCGMDKETLARIFEPFYTTKRQGEGTGLGLSTVYGIVEQSGGHIQVESELHRGSTFRIFLSRENVSKEAVPSSRNQFESEGKGTETVLLVEDEAVVRNLVREILKQTGYQILEAQHGAEALRVAIQHHGTIHLLLTDVVMPLMSGRDLARRLHEMRKETKVLFMSGYTDDVALRQGSLEPGTAFIQKPFTPDALSRKVRDVLDG